MNKFIAIEGVIGVGKTTLARRLQPAFDADLLLEVFEENPFLPNFYRDRERYAFQTQLFFLLSRYQQQRTGLEQLQNRNLISDYTFAKDELFAWLNLKDDELAMYGRVHVALAEKLPKPDLIIFLRASHDVLMRRITLRDRPYERDMDPEYIAHLSEAYDNWLNQLEDMPALVINTDHTDFLANEADLNAIYSMIKEKLVDAKRPAATAQSSQSAPELPDNFNFPELQQFHRQLDAFKSFNPDIIFNFVKMAEELGEVAAIIGNIQSSARQINADGIEWNKAVQQSVQAQKEALGEELVDLLAYIFKLTNYAGIDLEAAYSKKMQTNLQRQWH